MSRESEGQTVEIVVPPEEAGWVFEVHDDDGGIFEHLRQGLGLESSLEALQELTKGKVTTMPERHTGEVILDFNGVEGVGQGFADEVFRVWARDHSPTRLVPEHMNPAVRQMVERARHGDSLGPPAT